MNDPPKRYAKWKKLDVKKKKKNYTVYDLISINCLIGQIYKTESWSVVYLGLNLGAEINWK